MGSITPDHAGRFAMLEDLARRTDIAIWGRMDSVPEDSPLWARYRGPAWGRDMYNVLARSKITINQHIDIAEGHANNMRLYEATGVGALLLTDWKEDIGDIFTPGREIATYSSADECIDLINYYRTHETERAAIAAAGQQRTLSEHSFDKRVAELLAILPKFD
jgi:spore maturation protein CgeB